MSVRDINHRVFQHTVTNEMEAVCWVASLAQQGLLWHFDDDPRDVFNDGITDEMCRKLVARQVESRKILCASEHFEDVFDVALDFINNEGRRVSDYLKDYALGRITNE